MVLDIVALCRTLGEAFGTSGNAEPLHDCLGAYRIGVIAGADGARATFFLLTRSTASRYIEAFATLSARQNNQSIAIAIPTDTLLTDEVERQARIHNVTVVVLSHALDMTGGRFIADTGARQQLAQLGRPTVIGLDEVRSTVAQAFICDGASSPRWLDLDEGAYHALLKDSGRFVVIADQRQHIVIREETERPTPDSYFSTIRQAICKDNFYDPNIEGPDIVSGKQTFQRARKGFDIKLGKNKWNLFNTTLNEEGYAVYKLNSGSTLPFAYIFLPEG